jgi:hypothetical protein
MKSFHDLTDAEVLALTPAEVERYIDVECAQQGVPLLPPEPIEPEYDPEPEADVIVFSISGVSYSFTDRDAAVAIAAAVSGANRVDTAGTPARISPVPSYYEDAGELKEKRVLSEAAYVTARAVIEGNQAKKDCYEEAVKEFKNARTRRAEVAEEVYERRREVTDKAARKTFLDTQYARYLDLAGGDSAVATRFLIDAYPDATEHGYVDDRPEPENPGEQEAGVE